MAPPKVVQAPNESADSASPELPSLRYSMVDASSALWWAAVYASRRAILPAGKGARMMHASDGGIRDMLQRLLAPPDQVMRRLGASSERLVARVRLLLSVLALALPLSAAATGAGMGGILACLGAVVLANAVALAWLVLARQER